MAYFKLRPGRLVLSISIVGVALWGLSPSLMVTPSIDAVVNAEVVVVRAVTEGRVEGGPPPVGTLLASGELISRVVNRRQDQRFLGQLQTERASLQELIEALDRQKAALKRTAADLAGRVEGYRKFARKSFEHRVGEAKGRLVAIEAALENAHLAFRRHDKLITKGTVSQAAFDGARLEARRLSGERDASRQRLRDLETRLASVVNGHFLSEGLNDVPYSQQRLDEITIRQTDIAVRRSEYAIRVVEIDRQIEAERTRLTRMRTIHHTAPVDGIIWKRFVKPGNEVVIGTELVEIVDCGSTFLDVSLDEARFAELHIGQRATVRLVGSDQLFEARVRLLRGSGAVTEDRFLAARTEVRGAREFQAILDFDTSVAGAAAENFCLIGRSAEVALPSRFAVGGVRGVVQGIARLFRSVSPADARETE